MTISEKSAYLKGLMDGLKLNTESDEGKMIAAIVDLLGDVSKRVTDIEETTIAIYDELDWDDEDEDFDDEDPEEGFEFGDEDSTIYEVECACGEIIDFDEEVLEKGSIVCPNCGETLEFSLEDEE